MLLTEKNISKISREMLPDALLAQKYAVRVNTIQRIRAQYAKCAEKPACKRSNQP